MTETRRLRLVEPPGGLANSRPNVENDTLGDAGIDTVRIRWRGDRDAYERLTHRLGGVQEGARGERWARTETGARLGAFPDGLTYSEARAVTYVDGPDAAGLLAPSELPLAVEAARSQAQAETGELPENATLGRADLASELRFTDGGEGLAFLHALATIDVPWGKVGVEGRKGQAVETVNVRHVTGRSVQARAYDKGRETGTAEPGEWVRLERQMRFRKAREQSIGQFLSGDLRAAFLGRLRAFAGARDVVVTDVVGALETLSRLDLRPAKRNRLAGFLLYGARRSEYLGATGVPTSAYYRAVRELRELGVCVEPAAGAGRVVVPIGRYLDRLAQPWAEAA